MPERHLRQRWRSLWPRASRQLFDPGQWQLGLARWYHRAGRTTAAEWLYHRMVLRRPNNFAALAGLGRLLLHAERYEEAVGVWTQAASIRPQARSAAFQFARALHRSGRLEQAAAQYRHVLKLDPLHDKALTALDQLGRRTRLAYADALRVSGNNAEAVAQLGEVLAVQPRDPEALALLARIRARDNPEEAFACWSQLAELRPRAVEPHLQMARIRLRQRQMPEARQWFEAVLERDPDHAESLAGLGHALAETDRSEAIRHFTRWAERWPKNVAPRLELAKLHQRAHEWDRAEEIYQEVLERESHNSQALSRLAELFSRDRTKIDVALQLWQQISERDPSAAFPIVQRAVLYERLGRFDEAETEYRRAMACAPGDATAMMGLARLLSNGGQWAEAAELSAAVHRGHPDRTDALLIFGRCQERLGRDEEALAAYQQVLTLQPTNPNAPRYRGRLLRRLGRTDESIEQWERICERSPESIEAWCELVFMLASAEREAEALAALDAAEAALLASPQSWSRLGRAAESAQLHDRAVAYFQRAIGAEPNDADYQAQLGEYYRRQGIVDGAFHYLLASRELKPTQLPVARQLVDTVHILNDLGFDHLALRRAPPTTGEVLVPEGLFRLVRRLADTEVETYEPVPRRIIAITSSLAAGGAERQLVTMLRGLAEPRFGLDLSLFCVSLDARTGRDFFLPLLAGAPVEVVGLGDDAGRGALDGPEASRFSRLIGHFPDDMVGPIAFWLAEFWRRRPQVVHAWQDATNLAAVVAALLAGVPRIILCARSVRPDNPRRRLKRFMKEAYQAVLGHPSVLLSNNSRAGADDYADWLGLDPATIEVVYNGIDFTQLERSVDPAETQRARDQFAIPTGAPVLGSAFRMSEEKRPLLWVETAAAVAKKSPEAHFIVCGDGPMRTEMSDLAARLGIADRLHLPGPQGNIASWYKAMDVVMLTSRHEGLPNVLLEAQSLGVPVVAPDVGGMSETVWQGVTGWTVRDADAALLANRVLYCLDEEPWMTRARAEAPGFVKNRFSTTTMLDRTLELYGITLPPGAASGS